MGFLAPAFLALTALAAVPLIVHLLRRRINRTVEFPAVRYLQRMEQEHSRDLKLKNRLLLLLRILAVLALALAAARPIATLAGIGHAPVAMVLVIDNSMSSGLVVDGQRQLDRLQQEADALLASLTPDDRAWLVSADGRVVGGSTDGVRQALRAVQPFGGRGDLDAAVRRALSLVQSGAPRAPVVAIVSDGQANAFGTAGDSVLQVGNVPVIAFAGSNVDARKRAVTGVTPDPFRWTPAGALRLQFAAPETLAYRIVLDGRTVSRGTATAGTVARPALVEQRLSTASTGWLRGHVEVDADELRADDIRHFAVRVAPPPTVLLRQEGGEFLAAAVATLADERRIARAGVPDVSTITVASADAPGIRLPALLTAPLDPVRIGDANRTLARLGIPWRFGAIARNSVTSRVPRAVSENADTLPPALAAMDGARVLLRYPLDPSPGAAASQANAVDTLATAGNVPWIVAGDHYVIVGSPLDPDATDLPIRAAFLPWLLDMVSRRLGSDGTYISTHPGARLDDVVRATAIELPDSTMVPLPAQGPTAPSSPGVYFLRRGTDRIGALVVNPEPEESDLTRSGGDDFLSHIDGRNVSVHLAGDAWRRAVLEQAEGRALLAPLVMLALLLLLAEALVARAASGPPPPTPRDSSARRAA